MNIVNQVTTPLDKDRAKAAISNAWRIVLNVTPDVDSLALVMALVWVETGAGLSCKNFNVGNITASASYSGDAWRPDWFDEPGPDASARTKSLHAAMIKGQAPSAFRAYQSLESGALDFMGELERDFPEVLNAAATGDPNAFREALAQKYSHDYANPDVTRSFASLMGTFGGSPKVGTAGPVASSSPGSPQHSQSGSLPTLRVGASGSAVDLLCLLFGLPTSDVMTPLVEQLVKDYQRKQGLKADGEVGPMTWAKILDGLDALVTGAFV